MYRSLVVFAACLMLLIACGTILSTDQQAVSDATSAYLTNSENSSVTKVTVSDIKLDGDYARSYATPADETQTDPVFVFLKREGGSWTVLTFGTAFGPDDYQALGIPSSLWVGN